MAGLWLMTVMLVFLLSVGGVDAVDQTKLAELIKTVKDEYKLDSGFSVALSISEDLDTVKELLAENPEEEVKKQILKGEVYRGRRLAVAIVDKSRRAEWRVLQNLKLESNVGDLLVIYSHAFSCPTTCTDSPDDVIKEIKCVINHGNWNTHVFVFEKVFKPEKSFFTNSNKKLREAVENLGQSGIPLANIFRCSKMQNVNSNFQCTSCSNGGKVANMCIDYNV